MRKLRSTVPALLALIAAVVAGAGCSRPPATEAAPPPRPGAHALLPVQGKQPLPKLPVLKGDTRHQAGTNGP